MIGQRASERRRLQRPPALDEQRLAEPLLQHGERARDRRLGHAEQGRALGDAAGLDDGSELDQMAFVELHNDLLY